MEEARRAIKRADAVEATVGAAVEQLEMAHVELHRRSETLRQKTRTIYLIDRVLSLDASNDDPRDIPVDIFVKATTSSKNISATP